MVRKFKKSFFITTKKLNLRSLFNNYKRNYNQLRKFKFYKNGKR